VLLWVVLFLGPNLAAQEPLQNLSGDAVIEGAFRDSKVVIKTTSRLAGAIDSLTWKGQEFIDSHDHGRQLQPASSFDCSASQPFWAECFNPTEAGARADGRGNTSTSQLLAIETTVSSVKTVVQPAFWLAPGERSSGRPALNTEKLSQHRIAKEVYIGFGDDTSRWDNVIDYRVQFDIPSDETHRLGQFEVVTGYMPPIFSVFETYDPVTKELKPVDDGPGEQPFPIVFSTKDGEYAMGCLAWDLPGKPYVGPGYGRFRFVPEKVVKWNCVFRIRNETRIPTGSHSFRVLIPIGTRADVRSFFQQMSQIK
jgi:hypothetical protein